MVYRFQLTYDEITDILDLKHNPTDRTGYSLNPGIYEFTNISKTLQHGITIDDIRLKSNLKNNQTLIFTKNLFLHNNLFY